MRISLIQYDIAWENKETNLDFLSDQLKSLAGQTDIVVLPEMFSTGFSMKSSLLAEPMNGLTITTLKKWAYKYDFAIAGSFICNENEHYFNRAFFIPPQKPLFHYDKRHLFRMGEEPQYFHAGKQTGLFTYQGWNIRLAICYDLRFPVWLRNSNNAYDLLLLVANWPASRIQVWDTLLAARAIENQCYVCGVNRIGTDGLGLPYPGHSMLLDARGKCLIRSADNQTAISTVEIQLDALQHFRKKFPVWKDADNFEFTP